jgi:hypothetical protein
MPKAELSYPDLVHDEYDEPDHEGGLYCECTTAGHKGSGDERVYLIKRDGGTCEVDEDIYRIVGQYEVARRRQAEAEEACMGARGWAHPEVEPAEVDEPDPEAVPPEGKLTARQAVFCENYAAQPVATRAAVLAGYSEDSAHNQGHRLLKNPLVLARIAALRAERKLSYVIEPDTLQDKLEAVFFDALSDRNHSAAVAALRLQAGLARLPTRPAAAPEAGTRGARARKAKARRARRNDENRRIRGRRKDEK